MSYNCKALVICCIDFRFHSAIRDFLVSMGIKDNYDMVCLGGSTKAIADNDQAGKETLLKQIDISQRLHNISEIYLIHHMDCGAYGGRQAFENELKEKEKHSTDLEKSRQAIIEKFNNLNINKVIARLDSDKVDFEVVN